MWRHFLINWCCKTLPTCFFFKRNKTKQKDYEKKKIVSPGRNRTGDLQRERATHYPLRHAATTRTYCQINCIEHFCAHEINYSRWRRKCIRTTKWVPQKVTLEYHRNSKSVCCVLLTSNAITIKTSSQNVSLTLLQNVLKVHEHWVDNWRKRVSWMILEKQFQVPRNTVSSNFGVMHFVTMTIPMSLPYSCGGNFSKSFSMAT